MKITKSYIYLLVIVIPVVALTTVSAAPEIEIENYTTVYDDPVIDDPVIDDSSPAEYSILPNMFIGLNLAFYELGGTCEDPLLADSVQLSVVNDGCCIVPPHSPCHYDWQCFHEGGQCAIGCPF